MSTPAPAITILSPGDTLRFRDHERQGVSAGTLEKVVKPRHTPWLQAIREDGSRVVVSLGEVLARTGEAKPVRTPQLSLSIGTGIHYTDASLARAWGWIQAIDGNTLLVEKEDASLELITVSDLLAISA